MADLTAFLNPQTDGGVRPPVQPPGSSTKRAGSLLWATDHMVETKLTPDHINEQLRAFYLLTEAQLGQALQAGSKRLTTEGNATGVGPMMLLANVSGRLHLLYGFSGPPEGINITGRSNFRGTKPIVCYGHRGSDLELPFATPITHETLFKSKRAKLADFATAAALSVQTANEDDDGIPAPPTAAITEFRPFLPLFGKDICERVILGLYGDDGKTGTFWNWKHLPIHLNAYVNSISDESTHIAAQNAIMGMVTKAGRHHAGHIPLKSVAIPAPLKPWLKEHLNSVLNPKACYGIPRSICFRL